MLRHHYIFFKKINVAASAEWHFDNRTSMSCSSTKPFSYRICLLLVLTTLLTLCHAQWYAAINDITSIAQTQCSDASPKWLFYWSFTLFPPTISGGPSTSCGICMAASQKTCGWCWTTNSCQAGYVNGSYTNTQCSVANSNWAWLSCGPGNYNYDCPNPSSVSHHLRFICLCIRALFQTASSVQPMLGLFALLLVSIALCVT